MARPALSLLPLLSALPALCLAALPAMAPAQEPWPDGAPNRPEVSPAFPEQTDAPAVRSAGIAAPEAIATWLEHPWAVAVLPGDAGYLVTERPGRLRHVARDGTVSAPIEGVPEVLDRRQGGLLDVAVAPDFAESRMIYLTYARPRGLGRSTTAAARARLSADHRALEAVTIIFEQSPASVAPAHYGSRVVPLPDGTVAVTTGERFVARDLAQDLSVSYGVVARVTPEGSPAAGNPFTGVEDAQPTTFTYGHRNVQGAAVQPGTGTLWTVEHGPAGGDELNRIEAGANYGWPIVSYGENYNGSEVGLGEAAHAPDFTPPRYYWDPVIAPGGMVFYDGAMFPEWQGDVLIAGLIAQAVVRLDIDGDLVRGEERLAEGIDRVRDVAVDHDGAVLFVTDAPDGALWRLARDD